MRVRSLPSLLEAQTLKSALQNLSRAGLLYAASLWLSNSAYLYLSVSFIQMTKALMPGLASPLPLLARRS